MFTVGFDIDGCMNNIKEDLLLYGCEYYKSKGKKILTNTDGYYFREIFLDVQEEEYEEFWEMYGYRIYTNPPKKGLRETITRLKGMGVHVIAITTRNKSQNYDGQPFADITTAWMKKYDISMPVFYEKDKVKVIQQQNIKVMIEDKPDNIEKSQKVTRVLIFKHPYNSRMTGEFVTSWDEVFEKISKEIYCNT